MQKLKIRKEFYEWYSNGKLINTEETDKDLPLLYGKFDSKYFIELYNSIINSEFKYNEIESILYFPSRRWDLKLKDETLIKLSDSAIVEALKLVNFIKNKKKYMNIKVIDLRIQNRIITK